MQYYPNVREYVSKSWYSSSSENKMNLLKIALETINEDMKLKSDEEFLKIMEKRIDYFKYRPIDFTEIFSISPEDMDRYMTITGEENYVAQNHINFFPNNENINNTEDILNIEPDNIPNPFWDGK